MQKKNLTVLGAALAVGVIGLGALSPAMASPDSNRDRGQFRMFDFTAADADADGKLTAAEMDAYRAAKFGEADADGDGFLSRDEMLARALKQVEQSMGARIDRMLEMRDADKDGKLSPDEMVMENMAKRMFSRLDDDGDGAISKEELETARNRHGDRDGRGWGKHDRREHGKDRKHHRHDRDRD